MTKKNEVKEAIEGMLIDVNSWGRRFFRCYLDGSYNGVEHYRENILYISENQNKPKKMRMFVINSFSDFLQIEFPHISRGTIQTLVEELYNGQLDALNDALIDDAMDLIDN